MEQTVTLHDGFTFRERVAVRLALRIGADYLQQQLSKCEPGERPEILLDYARPEILLDYAATVSAYEKLTGHLF